MEKQLQKKLHEMDQALKELTSTETGRRVFIQAMPLLLAACASGSKSRYREGDNSGQEAKLTVEQEKRMTAEALPEMRKDYPQARDAELQRYIAGLGTKLTKANNLEGRPYSYNFSVVDVPYVNAFALPAGTIFVTAPLIELASSEAELIGVIGHEVGHVQARHTAERMFKAEKESKKSWLFGGGGGILGGLAGFGVGKLVCPPKDKACLAKAAGIGVAVGAAGGLLIQKYGFMQNSQEDEFEADRIGFRTAVKTGYHKDHVGRFYEKLLKMEQKARRNQDPISAFVADAMSTHPPSKERVQQMRELSSAQPVGNSRRISTKTFSRMRAKASRIAARSRARAKQQQQRQRG